MNENFLDELNKEGVSKQRFLLIDHWNPVNKRLFSLFRRENDVSTLDDIKFKNQLSKEENKKLLNSFISTKKIKYLVFTSEIFLDSNDLDTDEIIELILEIRKRDKVKIIAILIEKPIELIINEKKEISKIFNKYENYKKKLNQLKIKLSNKDDLLLTIDSYLGSGYIKDVPILSTDKRNHFKNILDHFTACKSTRIINLDLLINELRTNIKATGKISLKNCPEINLEDLVKVIKIDFQQDNYYEQIDSLVSKDLHIKTKYKNLLKDTIILSGYQQNCSLELIYRMNPETSFSNKKVSDVRFNLGRSLANFIPKNVKKELDIVVPVPETGKNYAKGLAKALNIEYAEGIEKSFEERSFDISKSSERKNFIASKLNIIPEILEGKNICLVDEAIFTGSTLSVVCSLLSKIRVKKIYIAIPSPECVSQCKFNMTPKRSLLLEYMRSEDLHKYFDVNGVFFKNGNDYIVELNKLASLCTKCFLKNDKEK